MSRLKLRVGESYISDLTAEIVTLIAETNKKDGHFTGDNGYRYTKTGCVSSRWNSRNKLNAVVHGCTMRSQKLIEEAR